MKIAVLLAAPWIPGSVDMTEYLRQLQRLGHESLMICLDHSKGPPDFEVKTGDQQALEDPNFYLPLKLDAVIAFTWFNSADIITAIKQAGANVLIRGDSDGLFSIRQFAAHHIRVRMSGTRGWMSQLTGVKHLLQRYLSSYQMEDSVRLQSLIATDIAVLETRVAEQNVIGFLKMQKREDLISKLHVVPHFVADEFLSADIKQERSNSVAAIGRWEDPQKNAPMLAKAIELHLARNPQTTFYLIGGERGREEFTSLTAKYPQVTYTGPQNVDGVRKYLSDARVLLSSSRWEGSPVVGNEALAMGVTIVGTPIPAFVDICARGEFGTIAKSHSAVALADALSTELNAWDSRQRDPQTIADFWRPLLSSEVVVAELARLVLGKSTTTPLAPRVMQAV